MKARHLLRIVLVMICLSHRGLADDDINLVMQQEGRSIVYITKQHDGDNANLDWGTGFIVSRRGYVLTAKHLLPRANEHLIATIGQRSGPPLRLTVIERNDTQDVALLQLEQTLYDQRQVRICSDPPDVGASLTVIGFPGDLGLTPTVVRLVNKNYQGSLAVDGHLAAGDSGAPVFNEFQDVIGIVDAGHPISGQSGMVIPISFSANLLQKIGMWPPHRCLSHANSSSSCVADLGYSHGIGAVCIPEMQSPLHGAIGDICYCQYEGVWKQGYFLSGDLSKYVPYAYPLPPAEFFEKNRHSGE